MLDQFFVDICCNGGLSFSTFEFFFCWSWMYVSLLTVLYCSALLNALKIGGETPPPFFVAELRHSTKLLICYPSIIFGRSI